MKTVNFTYWKDGKYYLGFLSDYPDYETQALSKEELIHNLKSLLEDVESGEVPYVRDRHRRLLQRPSFLCFGKRFGVIVSDSEESPPFFEIQGFFARCARSE